MEVVSGLLAVVGFVFGQVVKRRPPSILDPVSHNNIIII